MKLTLRGNTLTLIREDGDKKYYNGGYSDGESNLLYALKQKLQALGLDVLKKRMWHDGHMVSDTQQYVRTRNVKDNKPLFMLWNGSWAIHGIEEPWNRDGEVCLEVESNEAGYALLKGALGA